MAQVIISSPAASSGPPAVCRGASEAWLKALAALLLRNSYIPGDIDIDIEVTLNYHNMDI